MDRLLTRTLAAVALALIAMSLLKAGLDVFEEGLRPVRPRYRSVDRSLGYLVRVP